MRMGGGPQQFGVDAERVPDLLKDLDGLDFLGFHIFAGSQNLRAEILCEAQRKTVDLALRLAEHAPDTARVPQHRRRVRHPVLRAGHPARPRRDRRRTSPTLMDSAIRPNLPDAKIQVELGRYLVGEGGVYVTRVVDRKESRGKVFLVVDGGMHHQLAASGNFGQVIRRNYPLVVGNRMGEEPVGAATVVGCLCTPLDLLGDNVSLPAAEIGDLVVLFQAGAYGLTASPTAFLGHPAPAEVLV